MNRLILFALAVSTFAQGTLSLSNAGTVPPGGYAPGATVILDVTKTGNPTATGLQFDLVLPSGALSVAIGPAPPAGKQISCSTGLSIRCIVIGLADTNPIPDGVVAIATVTLAANASGTVVVTIANPVESDGNGNGLAVTVGNPTVSLSIRNRCDVDGNGSVSSSDTSAVVSVAILKSTTSQTDLNSDGLTNVLDAQITATAATAPNFVCNAH